MTLEDRWEDIKQDPKRLGRLFKIVWIAAYSMLILGVIVILYYLMATHLF